MMVYGGLERRLLRGAGCLVWGLGGYKGVTALFNCVPDIHFQLRVDGRF